MNFKIEEVLGSISSTITRGKNAGQLSFSRKFLVFKDGVEIAKRSSINEAKRLVKFIGNGGELGKYRLYSISKEMYESKYGVVTNKKVEVLIERI